MTTSTEVLDAILGNQQVRLPTPPDVYLRIVAATDLREVEDIIKYDAAVTARLLQIANSAMLSGTSQPGSVHAAVMRLGTAFTSSLVLALSLRDRFAVHGSMKEEAARAWETSIVTGARAAILSRELESGLNAGAALTAGILHNVGTLPIIDYFSEHGGLNFEEVNLALQARIGEIIMVRWGMVPRLVECSQVYPLELAPLPGKCTYQDLIVVSRQEPSELGELYCAKFGVTPGGVSAILSEYDHEISQLLRDFGVR